MLEALFRPIEEDGFWSEAEGRIVRALHYTCDDAGKRTWTPEMEERFRYGPMALMGIAMWRKSTIGDTRFDEKLRRNLVYYRELLSNPSTRKKLPGYGAGPLVYALSLLDDLWPEDQFGDTASSLIDFSLNEYDFRYNEEALVLMGMAEHFEQLSESERNRMQHILTDILRTQDEKGLFRTKEHLQSLRHQNQMYTIWGLGHADMALGTDTSKEGIRRCLQYTVDRRMLEDGALLWHHYRNSVHHLYSALQAAFFGRVPERKRLFSCHQAFFVYAVQVYRELMKDTNAFTDPRDNALRWEFGQNVVGENLFELNGIGVPTRIIITTGETELPTDRWVGIYEIGAMIMCMVKLIEEAPVAVA